MLFESLKNKLDFVPAACISYRAAGLLIQIQHGGEK
jgi:hypothetical protein